MEQCLAEMPITLLLQQTFKFVCVVHAIGFCFVWRSSNIHGEFLEKDDDVSHSTPKKRGFIHLGRVDRDVCGRNIFLFLFFLVYVNLVCEITDFVAMFG